MSYLNLKKAVVGPVDMSGMKSGFQFSADFYNEWQWRTFEPNNFMNLADLPS